MPRRGGEGDRQLAAYHFKDARKIFHHLAIPKSDHAIPVSANFPTSCVVSIALHRVLSAIQLDHQFGSRESEIDDKFPNRVLASKLGWDFELAYSTPEPFLSLCHIAPQIPRDHRPSLSATYLPSNYAPLRGRLLDQGGSRYSNSGLISGSAMTAQAAFRQARKKQLRRPVWHATPV